jgi:KRAB domain-containing zinc finger protein
VTPNSIFVCSEELLQPCRVDLGPNKNVPLNNSMKQNKPVLSLCGPRKSTDKQDAENKPLGTKRQHKCMLCNCAFTQRSGMLQHLRKKHAGLFILCKHNGLCSKIFRTETEKAEHILELKNKKFALKECDFCYKMYSESGTVSHFKRHHKHDNLIRCSYSRCPTRFRSEVEKQNHESLVHATTKKTKCIFCNLFFPYGSMLRHYQAMHKSLITTAFKCKFKCRGYFLTEAELNDHIASVHNTILLRQEFQCIYCNKIYADKQVLNSHIQNIHSAIKIVCKFFRCSQYFHDQTQADKHFEQQHQKKEESKIFQCLKCNYRATLNVDLMLHVARIHGGKSLPCPKCPKLFSCSGNLKLHIKRVHSPPQVCPHCNTSFLDIRKHLKQDKCKRCQKVLLCVHLSKVHKNVCNIAD